jgi:hypothetical protein
MLHHRHLILLVSINYTALDITALMDATLGLDHPGQPRLTQGTPNLHINHRTPQCNISNLTKSVLKVISIEKDACKQNGGYRKIDGCKKRWQMLLVTNED